MALKKAAGSQPSILFLHGEETFLAEEMIQEIRRRLFASSEEEAMGFTRFSLDESDWVEIIDRVRTGPLFYSGKRLILVTFPEGREERARERLTRMEERLLREYATAPFPETLLIIYYPGRIDRNNSFFRFLLSLDSPWIEEREFKPLKGKALLNWLASRLERQGKRAAPEALGCLVEVVGSDLRRLAGELNKLVLFCGERRQVELEDVEELCMAGRSFREWELTQALEEGTKARAFRILHRLLDEAPAPEYLVGILAQFFRELQLAREWLREGRDERVIFRELRPQIQESFGLFYEQRRDYFFRSLVCLTEEDLTLALEKLHSIDQALKTGAVSPVLLMEGLLHWYFQRREAKNGRAISRFQP